MAIIKYRITVFDPKERLGILKQVSKKLKKAGVIHKIIYSTIITQSELSAPPSGLVEVVMNDWAAQHKTFTCRGGRMDGARAWRVYEPTEFHGKKLVSWVNIKTLEV